ncbi:MAG: T9SS type A sorting domain-containing protein [Bacteroidia bacterium]
MKKLILLALLAFSMNAQAQFTLEATYDSASTDNSNEYGQGQLMVINFEVSGERYVKINRKGKLLSVYQMNHSLEKNIALPFLPTNPVGGDILYISQQLFNVDDKIEFMYVGSNYPSLGGFTAIYNEEGSVLFTEPGTPLVRVNFHQQQYPIYNTSQGTKMILSYSGSGEAKVFGLQGTLTQSQQLLNENLINEAYPNPAIYSTRIDYVFPKGITHGFIVFYDLQGQEVKRFHVDDTFTYLLVSVDDIAAGTYYYQLQTSLKNSEGKKLVVVK